MFSGIFDIYKFHISQFAACIGQSKVFIQYI